MITVKKRAEKKGMSRVMLVGIMAFALLIGIMLISALTTEEQNALMDELNSLEQNLTENSYLQPADYSALETFIKLNLSIKGDLSL